MTRGQLYVARVVLLLASLARGMVWHIRDIKYIDGLMQKICYSSAYALELRLFCIEPSISVEFLSSVLYKYI